MQCSSYKIRACWRPVTKGTDYCSTCTLTKISDELERLSITPLTQIQEVCPYFLKAIKSRNELLDMLLRKMYVFNKPLLLQFMKLPFIHDVFMTRLHIHTESFTCSTYGYLLRAGAVEDSICPVKCPRCIYTALVYSSNSEIKTNIVDSLVHRDYIYWSINKSLHNLPYSKHIYNGLVEAGYYGEAKKYKNDEIHPLEYGTLEMCCLAPLLKKRMSVLKDELLERSWHPTRVYHWVWNEDKKKNSYWPNQSYVFTKGIAGWML